MHNLYPELPYSVMAYATRVSELKVHLLDTATIDNQSKQFEGYLSVSFYTMVCIKIENIYISTNCHKIRRLKDLFCIRLACVSNDMNTITNNIWIQAATTNM